MHRIDFTFVLLASLCLGCNKTGIPDSVSEKIGDSVAYAQGAKSLDIPIADQSIDVAETIYRLPDSSQQVKCFVTWIDRLLACDMHKMNYKARRDYLNNVCNIFTTSIAFGLEQVHAKPETQLEVRLKLILRLREELDRIRPTRKRVISHVMGSQDNRQRYEEWRRCYLSLYRLHRLALDSLEEYDFPDMTKHLPKGRRDALQHSIEKRLGRTVRTRDAIRAERQTDADEYKAALSRQVEPSLTNVPESCASSR